MATGGAETSDVVRQLGGNISLVNMELDPMQMAVVKKIAGNHVKKLGEIANCKEIKIRLKKHEHGKAVLYEMDAQAIILSEGKEIILSANTSNYNLYSALSEALEKLLSEATHRVEQHQKG
jgi:ribosome-associated translation inhibitor RaiA